MWENVWTFSTVHYAIKFDVAPDDDLDLSWDDDGSVRERLEDGSLVAFVARVTVEKNGHQIGADYLSGCIYENPQAFINHRDPNPMRRNSSIMRSINGENVVICSYFPSMVRQAIADARRTLTVTPC